MCTFVLSNAHTNTYNAFRWTCYRNLPDGKSGIPALELKINREKFTVVNCYMSWGLHKLQKKKKKAQTTRCGTFEEILENVQHRFRYAWILHTKSRKQTWQNIKNRLDLDVPNYQYCGKARIMCRHIWRCFARTAWAAASDWSVNLCQWKEDKLL